MSSVIGIGHQGLATPSGLVELAQSTAGMKQQDVNEFFHFWGREKGDQNARANSWQHLARLQVGDKVYDLTDPKEYVAFKNDVADGCLDGKATGADGNVTFNDGIIKAGDKTYDIRKPEDVLRLKEDSKDGAIDGKVTSKPVAAKDGVDKPASTGATDSPANTNGTAPHAVTAPTSPTASNIPEANAPRTQDIPDFTHMSWSQIVNYIRNMLAGKEGEAKAKMKDLAKKASGLDANSPEAKELNAQIAEITDMVKQIEEIVTMLSNLQKGQHDLAMTMIRNLA
jgi:hypothetical protein